MEGPPPPERAPIVRRDGDRESVRDGIRVDGEREYRRVCDCGYQHGSIGACTFVCFSSEVLAFAYPRYSHDYHSLETSPVG